ncbi:MAG: glycosyltransferase [Candidatus Rokuibacteriota bacterium]
MDLPRFSVIIPVHNGESSIGTCLDSVMGLDYPRDRREIIVVDNMSTDRTREVVQQYPVTCLEERTRQSSYAARNRGIAVATGEILAFADADCRPRPGWLRAYAAHFGRHQDDYVSGPVDLVIDGPVGPCALYDKGKFFLQERYFRSGWGATANLAVRRALMDRVEAFDGSVISGGDVEFCLRARRNGARMGFCPDARVFHPVRGTLKALVKKHVRLGFGQAQLAFRHGNGFLLPFELDRLLPHLRILRRLPGLSYREVPPRLIPLLILVDWICGLAWAYGNVRGALTYRSPASVAGWVATKILTMPRARR